MSSWWRRRTGNFEGGGEKFVEQRQRFRVSALISLSLSLLHSWHTGIVYTYTLATCQHDTTVEYVTLEVGENTE